MRKALMHVLLCMTITAAGVTAAQAADTGAERILRFHSLVRVDKDASINVTETITVLCRGETIRRGIYRDFPVNYPERLGLKKRVPFEVISVMRDGMPEEYRTAEESGSVRIYIGKSDYFLPKDRVYTYAITYRTSGLLQYENNFDSLYWNVTGNFWSFPMDTVEATVDVPGEIIFSDAWTGPAGSLAGDFTSEKKSALSVFFRTTRPLSTGEGLTVRVNFPAGIVYRPTVKQERAELVQSNPGAFILLGGMLFVLLYYITAWFLVGRDPAKGKIGMRFEPPENLSPAAVRYVSRMAFDTRTMASGIMSLAVKDAITISSENDELVLHKKEGGAKNLSPDEDVLLRNLFTLGDTLALDRAHSGGISLAMNALNRHLKKSYQKVYFFSNTRYFVPGVLASLGIIAGSILADAQHGMDPGTFLLLWLSMWTLGAAALMFAVAKAWKEGLKSGEKGKAGAVFLSLFSIPFIVAEVVVLAIYLSTGSALMLILALIIILLNPVFFRLLKAPTRKGRAVMDIIDGFRMYLSASEKQKSPLHPAGASADTFEANLAYAIALDVENTWAGAFDPVLSPGAYGTTYSPRWYSGTCSAGIGAGVLAAGIGSSICSALSTSTSGSGSSSGSSGGGGGGGGGGGW